MADVQAVVTALNAFNQPSDKTSFEQANSWLQDFQHSNEAWATCNVLLLSQDSPPLARIFAAQTFRAKVTYDLNQLDPSHLPSLRDTILAALEGCTTGPKIIIVQLSLALAGLALQLPSWQTSAVSDVIKKFGQNPVTVPTLLEFLTILPEEINGNSKIPISNDEYKDGAGKLLTENANQVLALLAMYLAAPGVTSSVQSQIFNCLRSWIVAGELSATEVSNTPLLGFAFEALDSPALFDAAVDIICDLIHETQELDENMPVIQIIVPKLIELKPRIAAAKGDTDQVRGYARIFSEAGEVYRLLLLQHPETFFPIVEAIGECSACADLEVVPITFQFWLRLAQSIGKKPSVSPLFFSAYKSLMTVMIQHLYFPADPSAMNAQEMDEFRSFRHVMGDTLKDCCFVLGSEHCLATVYEYISSALLRVDASGQSSVSWQEIEAPLFGLRSMGAEVDPKDDKIVPKIMDIMPSLPNHPRVRYAAILVMSRYSEWTNQHPSYIPFQLQFISSGFESADEEVPAAASQAMKYLCLDCSTHMIPFLPQLHSFLASHGSKMIQDDRRRVYEAVAHVISAMPMAAAAQSLHTFSVDILAKIHAVVTKTSPVSKAEFADVSDALESLETMLNVVKTFGDELPPSCANNCHEAWSIIDALLAKYSVQNDISERTSRVLRRGLEFFGSSASHVVPSLLSRMASSFELSGLSSFLWITGKAIDLFGDGGNTAIRAGIKDCYERVTVKTVSLLQERGLRDIPDVMEDYIHLLLQLQDRTPDIFYESSSFPTAFRIAVAALPLIHSEVVYASLDLVRAIVSHDCLDVSQTNQPPKFPIYATAIRKVVVEEGPTLTGNLLSGIVNDFPQESVSTVNSIIRMLAASWPRQMLSWLPRVLEQVPMAASFAPAKKQLLTDMTSAINKGEFDKVRHAVITFHRFCSKSRDRRRIAPLYD